MKYKTERRTILKNMKSACYGGFFLLLTNCSKCNTPLGIGGVSVRAVSEKVMALPFLMKNSYAPISAAVKKESLTIPGVALSGVGSFSGKILGGVFGGPLSMSVTRGVSSFLFPQQASTFLGSCAQYAANQHAIGIAYGLGNTYGPMLGGIVGGFCGPTAIAGSKLAYNCLVQKYRLHNAKKDWEKYKNENAEPCFTEKIDKLNVADNEYAVVDCEDSLGSVFDFKDSLFDEEV